MSTTPLIGIPELEAAQAQPELVVNKALRMLEAMAPLQCIDRDLSAPPGSPADGDRYIVGPMATGAWVGKENQVALNLNGTWVFIAPRTGWRCWVEDESLDVQYSGGSPDGWF